MLCHEVSFGAVRYSEWLAFAYFVWLLAAGWVRELPRSRRWQMTAGALLMCAIIAAVARLAPLIGRDWAAGFYVLVGYYLSGRLYFVTSPRMEGWLEDWDRRLLGHPETRFVAWPRWLLSYLEFVYLGTFMLLPLGLGALVWTGHEAQTDRFWTMVIAAEFGAFAPLAIVQTRPPWAIESGSRPPDGGIHRLASALVRHGTIGANTFPSGHAAGSLAVAFAVIGTLPWIGALLLW